MGGDVVAVEQRRSGRGEPLPIPGDHPSLRAHCDRGVDSRVAEPLTVRDAPRRASDDRIFEAVFHFNLYMYLTQFLATYQGQVLPEFPTGNGKIDLLIRYAGAIYGLEVKSFINAVEYRHALAQAARYAQQLQLREIWLVLFVDAVDEENRQQYQVTYTDAATGTMVYPQFVVTG